MYRSAICGQFGDTIGPFTSRLVHWAWEEGHCDEATRDKDWVNYGTALLTGAESEAGFEEVKAAIEPAELSAMLARLGAMQNAGGAAD